MRNPRQGAIPSELGDLIDRLNDYEERLRRLEAPSGEALSSTVAKLQALVADIQAQIDAWAASRWTNAQIDARIDSKVAAAIAALLAGNVAIAGNLSAGGTLYAGGKVTLPGVYALNVVTAGRPRTTAWVDSIGELGHT